MNTYEVRKKFDNLTPWEWFSVELETYERTRILYRNLHKDTSKWSKYLKVSMKNKKIIVERLEE